MPSRLAPPPDWALRTGEAARTTVFEAGGRIAVHAYGADAADAGESSAQGQHVSGKFRWVESELTSGASRSHVSLFSPLGETMATLTTIDQFAELRTPDRIEYGSSPEELLARTLDVVVPVRGLRWWLRGRDEQGAMHAPASFDEQGWHITFVQMQGDRPRVVRLERSKPQRLDLRLVIDEWEGTP
jgi:outer membrane biogenesis lipoprotein LolB